MQFFSSNFKLGILGGGQLGKMILFDAKRYDVFTKVMDPDKNSPCRKLADEFVVGDFTNYDDVLKFGQDLDLITVEIEKINTDALHSLENMGKKVYPSAKTLKIIQNKATQKEFYKKNGLPTSNFKKYSDIDRLKKDIISNNVELPAVWKSSNFGYDGKGVKVINSINDIDSLINTECILEEKVKIKKELSIIVSRNVAGDIESFPVVEMEFNKLSNLVEYVICPAKISRDLEKKALKIAETVAKKFEIVGLLAVELFLTEHGKILINEVAPRPHNSGHHTIECCKTSQFDQHLRCILDLPLGDTSLLTPGIMVNLVGENKIEGNVIYQNINDIFDISGVNVHIYGKKKSRLNRKMGHITIVNDNLDNAIEIGKKIKKKIKVYS